VQIVAGKESKAGTLISGHVFRRRQVSKSSRTLPLVFRRADSVRADTGPQTVLKAFPAAGGARGITATGQPLRIFQAAGDFLRRIVKDVAKQTSLPQVRWELHNRFRQQPPHFAACAAFLGILLFGGDAAAQRLVAFAFALIERSDLAVTALAQ